MVEIQLVGLSNHESRHSSYNRVDAIEENPVEETPLLRRFPPANGAPSGPLTTIIVTFLIIILVSGVIIGIYLLILQSRAENVLPPVDMPLQLVSRVQWEGDEGPILSMAGRPANQVIVMHTSGEECFDTQTCSQLLRSMQNKTEGSLVTLPYNFLVSSDGLTYEALGWRRSSPLFPHHPDALVVAFIGNFTNSAPTRAQLAEANNLFAESISRQHLTPDYMIFGKSTKDTPKYLFSSMETLPQWRKDLSD